jgi:hypothetical protein
MSVCIPTYRRHKARNLAVVTLKPAMVVAAEYLQQLVRWAERGDESVLPQLRRLLDHEPGLRCYAGDMGRIAEDSLIEVASGPHLMLKESLARKLTELKAKLAGPAPSVLDCLLAERVAIC